jgi:hypothetical protein
VFLLGIGSFYLGGYLLLVCLLLYQLHLRGLKQDVKHTDDQILAEIPEFFSYISSELASSKDLIYIIEVYLVVAGSALAGELTRLLADLRTGNTDQALLSLDLRLDIPQLSGFLSAVRAAADGEIKADALDVFAVDMEIYEHEAAAKKSSEIPGKISRASFVVAGAAILFFLALMCFTVLIGIRQIY